VHLAWSVKVIDFSPKQLTIQDSNLKEVDGGKKTKKQSYDSAASAAQIAVAEKKVSEGGAGSSAAAASVPAEPSALT
jgi:hypothetical protein